MQSTADYDDLNPFEEVDDDNNGDNAVEEGQMHQYSDINSPGVGDNEDDGHEGAVSEEQKETAAGNAVPPPQQQQEQEQEQEQQLGAGAEDQQEVEPPASSPPTPPTTQPAATAATDVHDTSTANVWMASTAVTRAKLDVLSSISNFEDRRSRAEATVRNCVRR